MTVQAGYGFAGWLSVDDCTGWLSLCMTEQAG